ncbi:MAG: ribosome maturation factor RimP [Nitrospiraceae bacterium]|nr:MAG: ribosome maturation factor RimP [Nitrospiraceae bacterium]
MNTDKIKNKVLEIIEPVIKSLGLAVDRVEFGKMGRKGLLRVFIEKESGVTIDDCERASREIEAALDVEDPIPYSYVLEVSSPGLDRPLASPADFRKHTGKTVRVVTHEPIDRQSFFTGIISEAGDDGISLLLPKDKTVVIPYKNISKARLEVEI